MSTQKTIYGKRSQAQYLVFLVIGFLFILFLISPGAVVWVGKTAGNTIIWVVTKLVGMLGSLVTGLATAIFG